MCFFAYIDNGGKPAGCFPFSMVIGGFLSHKIGPRAAAFTGCMLATYVSLSEENVLIWLVVVCSRSRPQCYVQLDRRAATSFISKVSKPILSVTFLILGLDDDFQRVFLFYIFRWHHRTLRYLLFFMQTTWIRWEKYLLCIVFCHFKVCLLKFLFSLSKQIIPTFFLYCSEYS